MASTYQQEFCFVQLGMEGGGFSWPVPTRGILLHAVRYGRRWFQLASTYQQEFCLMQFGMEGGGFRGKARTNTECTEQCLVLPFYIQVLIH